MSATIKIKQVPDAFAITTGLDKYNKSRMPGCVDIYQAAQDTDGRFITGLDEDAKEIYRIENSEVKEAKKQEILSLRLKLQGRLGKDVDLSATSKFWETFFVEISTDKDLILDPSDAWDVIKHRVLISNGLAAPDFDSTGSPKYRNAKYYCFTEEKFEEEQVSTQKLRDKARSLLYEMSNNDDKMLLIGQYLEGFRYKKGLKPDTLYSMLSQFIEKDKQGVEKFLAASQTSVEDLQYTVTVNKAIKSKTIRFKNGQYYRGGVNLGKNVVEVLDNLKSPEYANEFLSIHEEVK